MKSNWIPWLAVLVASTCLSQTTPATPKKAQPKPQPTPAPLVCPDPTFKEGCKSYNELLAAKDKGLPDNDYYVCFRKDVDEFFLFSVSRPYYSLVWSDTLKKSVVDPKATFPGFGFIESYKDGVENDSVTPQANFSGTWKSYGRDLGLFSSDEINGQEKDPKDDVTGISINEAQVNVAFKYKNQLGNTVIYSLIIQSSTGRFTESFRQEPEKVAFLSNAGRCVYRK